MTDLGDNLSQMEGGQLRVQPALPKKAKPAVVDTVRILIEENPDIPPTGLFLGHNGRGYMIKAGMPVNVKPELLEILDNAIVSVPQRDPQTQQIVGYRDRLRFPYRVLKAA